MKYGRKFALAIYFGTGMMLLSLVAMLLRIEQPDAAVGALGIFGAAVAGASAYEDGKKSDNGGSNGAA